MENGKPRSAITIDEAQKIEFTALQAFILRSTVPIMVETETNRPLPTATGTLFRINERYFIITARHNFESNVDWLSQLALPADLTNKRFIRLLGIQSSIPRQDFVDVAAIEITDHDSVQAIKENWTFLTLDNVKVTPPRGQVWIVGYPTDQRWLEQQVPRILPTTIVTELLPDIPAEATPPVHAGLDLFFLYAYEAYALGQGVQRTPEMPGVSGASIWEFDRQSQPTGAWLPERFTKSVAIQSSYMRSKYIRGKSWVAVAKLLALIDNELKEAIYAKTGIEPDLQPSRSP